MKGSDEFDEWTCDDYVSSICYLRYKVSRLIAWPSIKASLLGNKILSMRYRREIINLKIKILQDEEIARGCWNL